MKITDALKVEGISEKMIESGKCVIENYIRRLEPAPVQECDA